MRKTKLLQNRGPLLLLSWFDAFFLNHGSATTSFNQNAKPKFSTTRNTNSLTCYIPSGVISGLIANMATTSIFGFGWGYSSIDDIDVAFLIFHSQYIYFYSTDNFLMGYHNPTQERERKRENQFSQSNNQVKTTRTISLHIRANNTHTHTHISNMLCYPI